MTLILNLTNQELAELRRRTSASDDADAVSAAAREYLKTCRSRELTTKAADLDYDENAWRELDDAELSLPVGDIELNKHSDG